MKHLDVLFTPRAFEVLPDLDLSDTICVVFDILRATSTMTTALAHGAEAIFPCLDIRQALQMHAADPELLLAGERNGLKIGADLTGGVEFHLGNSPLEFTEAKVKNSRIAMTTTNGTRALVACRGAFMVWAGSFLNLSTLAQRLKEYSDKDVLLVCAGTGDDAAYEDTLGAGAVCSELIDDRIQWAWTDAARMALRLFQLEEEDLLSAMKHSRNGRRLLNMEGLRNDVDYCLKMDAHPVLGIQAPDGSLQRLHSHG